MRPTPGDKSWRVQTQSAAHNTVKIVQLIRANQLLGLLSDGAVLSGGQQLRADRRIQNIHQHITQHRLAAGIGHVLHNVTHQRFGHPGVHTVHAHVVAVVGGPAEGQLAQVSGADHKAAVLVGVIHQFQRAHTGLAVFKGHIIGVRVLADIGKVAFHRVGDVDLGKADTQCFAQNLRVGAGALGSSKAGHGNGNNVLGVTAQHLAGTHGNQQSQTESSPPEIPTTAHLAWVCSIRLARPSAWMRKISSQRSARAASFCGTNGVGETNRVSGASATSKSKLMVVYPAASGTKVVLRYAPAPCGQGPARS